MTISVKDIVAKKLSERRQVKGPGRCPRTNGVRHFSLPFVSGFNRSEIAPRQIFKSQRMLRREVFAKGITGFLLELAEKFPQVSSEGEVMYYICGSLSVMAMSIAERYEVLDQAALPQIVPERTVRLSPYARQALGRFFRKIGDFDFVTLPNAPTDLAIRKGFLDSDDDFTQWQRVWTTVRSDRLETYTPHRIARVTIRGQKIYIVEPKMMLAYKIVHLGESFYKESKTKKFVSDLRALLRGLGQLYSHAELIKAAHEAVSAYAQGRPNLLYIPYYHPAFNGEIKAFIDEIVRYDADAPYLRDLEFGQERSIGILSILHRLQTPAAKATMISFINSHREAIDRWTAGEQARPVSSGLLSTLARVDEAHLERELTALSTIMRKLAHEEGAVSIILSYSEAAAQTETRQVILGALEKIAQEIDPKKQTKILDQLHALVVRRELFILKNWHVLSLEERIALIPRILAGETLEGLGLYSRS